MSNLTPDYRDIDFQTMVARLRTLLSDTESFKDYDLEGANITILMELVSYVGDLNTYFTNKLAQNIHTETANVYEVVHSLVRQQGHEPSGYIGAELVMKVRVYQTSEAPAVVNFTTGDQLLIPQWFSMDTGLKDSTGSPIYYTLTEDFTYTATAGDVGVGYAEFEITLRQGIPLSEPLEYTGEDIVSNQIVLPFRNWDMSTYPYDDSPLSIEVLVGDAEEGWVRISDFFDEISGLVEENNAYMLTYDKYERSVLAFSNTRNIPALTDAIKVFVLETLGLDGLITKLVYSTTLVDGRLEQTTGTTPSTSDIFGQERPFITNISKSFVIPVDQYTVENEEGSYGASNPQTLEELKDSGMAAANSQQRNVTKTDYMGNLEARGDITVANAWGEQEENPNVLVLENYNKAYISTIPTGWENGVYTEVDVFSHEVGTDFSGLPASPPNFINFPDDYNSDWVIELLAYLEPRKMLGIYEQFELPELVYFRLDFGLKTKRTYSWIDVKETIKRKLVYYFSNPNRKFGDVIDFREIHDYILDVSNVSDTDDFALVRGIQHLVIRDVLTYRDPARIEDGVSTEEIPNSNPSTTYCEAMGGTIEPGNVCSIDSEIDEMYIYEENIYNYFPYWVDTSTPDAHATDNVYNQLRPIQLGYKQFPQLSIDFCVFTKEG
jgi:hypothetical protein